MSKLVLTLIVGLLISVFSFIHAQCPGLSPGTHTLCDPLLSSISLAHSGNIDFSFDQFNEINGGITQSGSTQIRVKAKNNPTSACQWKLVMYVNNFSGTTTPTDWSKQQNYGLSASGAIPKLDLIEIRVDNFCHTPFNSGQWQRFAALNGASIDIINSSSLVPSGACSAQVNGDGDYLTNFGEFNFTVDYRIIPGVSKTPGVYTIKLTFCLSEM